MIRRCRFGFAAYFLEFPLAHFLTENLLNGGIDGTNLCAIRYEHPLPLVPRSGRKGPHLPPSPSIGDAALKLGGRKNRPMGERGSSSLGGHSQIGERQNLQGFAYAAHSQKCQPLAVRFLAALRGARARKKTASNQCGLLANTLSYSATCAADQSSQFRFTSTTAMLLSVPDTTKKEKAAQPCGFGRPIRV